ncbi:hypothetical protein HD597_011997 [Nonomuraea thailandensis]|uniref:Uncharacterized protein n=1 Tax=Nonomuraea thailandensis TaxID=1188745 RepID=A0A9X2GW86_9ACTN|nr:hypothetical protein [Nonomuraea thailandensis]
MPALLVQRAYQYRRYRAPGRRARERARRGRKQARACGTVHDRAVNAA